MLLPAITNSSEGDRYLKQFGFEYHGIPQRHQEQHVEFSSLKIQHKYGYDGDLQSWSGCSFF
jgi:hypothetical protein